MPAEVIGARREQSATGDQIARRRSLRGNAIYHHQPSRMQAYRNGAAVQEPDGPLLRVRVRIFKDTVCSLPESVEVRGKRRRRGVLLLQEGANRWRVGGATPARFDSRGPVEARKDGSGCTSLPSAEGLGKGEICCHAQALWPLQNSMPILLLPASLNFQQ